MLYNDITKIIDCKVDQFISVIAKESGNDAASLRKIWNDVISSKSSETCQEISSVDNEAANNHCETAPSVETGVENDNTIASLDSLSEKELMKMKKIDLQVLCRKNRKRSVGTKKQLVEYLLNIDLSEDTDTDAKSSAQNRTQPVEKAKGVTNKNQVKISPVITNLLNTSQRNVMLEKNESGLYVDTETRFVFNKDKKVYGKLAEGSYSEVCDISKSDIEVCKMYGWVHTLPSNLDASSSDKNGVADIDHEVDKIIQECDQEYNDENDDNEEPQVSDSDNKVCDDDDSCYSDLDEEELLSDVDDDVDE